MPYMKLSWEAFQAAAQKGMFCFYTSDATSIKTFAWYRSGQWLVFELDPPAPKSEFPALAAQYVSSHLRSSVTEAIEVKDLRA